MKLSITAAETAPAMAPFVLRGSYLEAIETAAQIGYDAVELHPRDPEEVDQRAILAFCQKKNIRISSLGTGLGYAMDQLSLTSPDERMRELAIERVCSHIRFAKESEAVVIIGLIKGLVKESENYQAYENRLIESLNRCLDFAGKHQVTLVLEAINRFESDALQSIESTAAFIRQFDSKLLKLHIDTFHINIEESEIKGPILRARDVLGHVHFADNNRMYPGKGFFDFKKVLDALKKADYQGYIAMECLSLPSAEEAAQGAYTYIQKLLHD
ncbi:sugar phosphate isomerase/epimerase family protein [Ammoniphilus resinae]|uniref:Sugar phosphate isomerase/epimerase n=1 Tax=Ammoniphilus resinae TaxID=861532 RepID=A0ABS4GPI7_9BACL|nr:sugar phosphate isomerase/epimerase family protein [Ammoniphilus resinae]MBP1932183.1 sugar phosphate isomerase/epimerase [Ammoniphilus resinae]